MDVAYLRELAEEGAAIHSDPQPEREVCDGLLWALDEIDRLRAVALQHVPHSYEGDCPDELDRTRRDKNCPACGLLGDA